jgi:ketosteroid isomerase-like protein
MQRYQVAARSVNPDSIAAFYAPTAILFEPGIHPIQTRDSIRAFLASFPGVRVEVATATPDTIEIVDGMALYWGSYFERLDFPGQPQSEQHGKFVAQWVRQADGIWLIQRLYRIPLPAPGPQSAPAP